MDYVSEIKCPACGQWCRWTGKVDDKCTGCGEYLEPQRFLYQSQKKITEDYSKKDYFIVRDSDETIVQLFKMFVNSFRYGSYYIMLLFFIFITVLLLTFGLLAA